MNDDEAEREVRRIRDLMPLAKAEQVVNLVTFAAAYPLDIVQAAVNAHAAANRFLDVPVVFQDIRSRCPEIAAEERKRTHDEAYPGNLSMRRMAEQLEAEKVECSEIRKHWEAIEKTIRSMSDKELEELKPHAIERLRPEIQDLHRHKNPRRSRLLKDEIVKLVVEREAVRSHQDSNRFHLTPSGHAAALPAAKRDHEHNS